MNISLFGPQSDKLIKTNELYRVLKQSRDHLMSKFGSIYINEDLKYKLDQFQFNFDCDLNSDLLIYLVSIDDLIDLSPYPLNYFDKWNDKKEQNLNEIKEWYSKYKTVTTQDKMWVILFDSDKHWTFKKTRINQVSEIIQATRITNRTVLMYDIETLSDMLHCVLV